MGLVVSITKRLLLNKKNKLENEINNLKQLPPSLENVTRMTQLADQLQKCLYSLSKHDTHE